MTRILMAAMAALALATPASAAIPSPEAQVYSQAILVEPSTGTVLYQKNPDTPGPIASMTKMMTMLVVLDQIEKGALSWDTPVTTSAKASLMGGSQVYLRHNEVFPVRDLSAAVMVHSANDAAMALAQHIGGGDEQKFVALMNQKAKELGLKQTRFYSPHGLPGEGGQPDDLSSPRDLAKMGWTLMQHPEMKRLAKVQEMPFRGGQFKLWSPNLLLDIYPQATGLKTGTHDRAGSCVTATAEKDGMELIAVLMGGTHRRTLFEQARDIFETTFEQYEIVVPVKKGSAAPRPLPVSNGRAAEVTAVAAVDGRLVVKKDEKDAIGTALQVINPPAPVARGERVGWMLVTRDGRPVGRVPLVATIAIGEATLLQRFWEKVWPW